MPPKRATQSQSATTRASRKTARGAGGGEALTRLKRVKREGGSQSGTPAAAAVQVSRKRSRGAVPTVAAPPPPTAGGIPRNAPAAAAAGGQGNGEEAHYQALRQQLKDFFNVEKVTARGLSDKEKKRIKKLAGNINEQLSAEEVEDMVDTAQTRGDWKRALRAARREGKVNVAKAVSVFARSRFSLESFPSNDMPLFTAEELIADFLKLSLVHNTLEEHLKGRLRDPSFIKAAQTCSFPIICRKFYISDFIMELGVVYEEGIVTEDEFAPKNNAENEEKVAENQNSGRRANTEVSDARKLAAATEGQTRTELFPVAIGGESGSGKTVFSVLLPPFILRGRGEAENARPLIIYTRASNAKATHEHLLISISTEDDNIQKSKVSGTSSISARERRLSSAASYLEELVRVAVGWRGPLKLNAKYSHAFIIVDELSTYPLLFRALLVDAMEQERLLAFTSEFADSAQLICCATGSRSVINESGSCPSAYKGIHMGPSTQFLTKLLTSNGRTGAFARKFLDNWVFEAVTENRRVATYAAKLILRKIGSRNTNKCYDFDSCSDRDFYEEATNIALDAVARYCADNGLSEYSSRTATAVMLEGLRRAIMWDPKTNPDVDGLFRPMGVCNPLRLGTFSVDITDVPNADSEAGPAEQEVTLSVTRAQLVMTAVRYGLPAAALRRSGQAFERQSAWVFSAFLQAVRVLDPWSEEVAPRDFLWKNVGANDDDEVLKFARALRGTEEVLPPAVSLAAFLRALDDKWTRGLSKTQLSSTDAVDPEEVMLTHSSVELPGDLPHKLQPGTEEHTQNIDSFFAEMRIKVDIGIAVVMLNADQACYADFIAVCGDVLFLGRCKDCPTVGFGETDEVREELARMGFMCADGTGDSFPAKTTSEDWEECAAFTQSLMKTFGCRIAVPLFYLSERTSVVELSTKGREVIAAGHGWRGPVPFVRVLSGIKKSFVRPKVPTPLPSSSASCDTSGNTSPDTNGITSTDTSGITSPDTSGIAAAAPRTKAANRNTTQQKKPAPRRSAEASPKKRTKSSRRK